MIIYGTESGAKRPFGPCVCVCAILQRQTVTHTVHTHTHTHAFFFSVTYVFSLFTFDKGYLHHVF